MGCRAIWGYRTIMFYGMQGYFGKSPSEMNFDECTLLAGIPNAPSNYNPVASEELSRQRQDQVIEKMRSAGFLKELE